MERDLHVILITDTGQRASNSCDENWIINSQSSGQFAGTFVASGGTTTTCARSGSLTGRFSTSGALEQLAFSVTIGMQPGCERTSGTGVYTGVMSATSLTGQTTDRTRCCIGSTCIVADRTLNVSMMKQ